MSNIDIKYIDINKLMPSNYNPRKASEKECLDLKKSITKFGIVDPIIVNSAKERKNIVIGGHFRLRMCKELEYKEVPVVYLDIPDIEKEQELNIRLNKNSGQFDLDLLVNFDEKLLIDIGFDSKELDNIFQSEDNQKELELKSLFQIIIDCDNEKEQEEKYNKLLKDGYKCRILTL